KKLELETRVSELRALGGNAKIAAQRQRKPARNRRAVYRGNGRLIKAAKKDYQLVHVLAHLEHGFHSVPSIASRILEVAADVAPRAETPSRTGDDHGSHLVIVAQIGRASC